MTGQLGASAEQLRARRGRGRNPSLPVVCAEHATADVSERTVGGRFRRLAAQAKPTSPGSAGGALGDVSHLTGEGSRTMNEDLLQQLRMEKAARLADVADLQVQIDVLKRQLRELAESFADHRNYAA